MTFYSDNVFFFRHLNSIGGIESFFYYLAKKYSDYDITIFYMSGDTKQYRRLAKHVRVRKYIPPIEIECKNAFFNFNIDIIDSVKAENYYQIFHGDYKAMGIKPPTHPKLTNYIGVSQTVCDNAPYQPVSLCYNPVGIDSPRKLLKLISATRLSHEKGRSRMLKFISILETNNIPFIWFLLSDINPINHPDVINIPTKLNIAEYITLADYLVQFSDNEGYCYSTVEANMLGVPCITTPCPVFSELGIQGYIVDFDLDDVPIQDIYNNIPTVTDFKPPADRWNEFLYPGKSTYEKDFSEMVTVQAIKPYYDLELKRNINKGEKIRVNRARAERHLNSMVGVIVDDRQ